MISDLSTQHSTGIDRLLNSQLNLVKLSLPIRSYCAEKLEKKSTQSHKTDTKNTKIKNNNHFNLSLCSLWWLGAFVFEDFFCQ